MGNSDQGYASTRFSPWIPAVIVGAALAIAFIAPIHSELRAQVIPQDEGLLLAYPSIMLHNAVPNRTFESVYGASNLWIIAAAFKVAGYSVTVERSVGIAYRLVIVASLVVLAWRRRGPIAAFASGTMCIVLIEDRVGLQAYAWLCALAFAALGFLLLDIGLAHGLRRWPLAISGLCLGLAVCARLDMAFGVFLVLVALWISSKQSLPWVLAGVVAGLVLLAALVFRSGVAAVVRDQIIQPIFVSGPGRRLPLGKLTPQELVLLFLCLGVAVASVVVGVVIVRRTNADQNSARRRDAGFLLGIGAFEVGILPEAFQRNDQLHLALVACFILPAAVLLPAWPRRTLSGNWLPLIVGAVVLLMAEPYFGTSFWTAALGAHGRVEHLVSNDGRSVPVASRRDQKDLKALLKEVDTRSRPGQRVFVGPLNLRTANYNDTFIYFLLPNLLPGSYYLEMNPGVANGKESQLAQDLEKDNVLILTSSYDKWPDVDRSTRFGPATPNQIVRREFTKIDKHGPWTLYVRKS